MSKYVKKPVVVEAFNFPQDEFPNWILSNDNVEIYSNYIIIHKPEGDLVVTPGYYIVKETEVENEIYPCKKEIFEKIFYKDE